MVSYTVKLCLPQIVPACLVKIELCFHCNPTTCINLVGMVGVQHVQHVQRICEVQYLNKYASVDSSSFKNSREPMYTLPDLGGHAYQYRIFVEKVMLTLVTCSSVLHSF
jgi:hypothetical protein